VPPKQEKDDKGKPAPPPKKDPKDPDRNLPGVKGTPDNLTKGQIVTVTLGRTNDPQNPQVFATMVVVTYEPPPKNNP